MKIPSSDIIKISDSLSVVVGKISDDCKYWLYVDESPIVITKTNLPSGWFDKLHDKGSYRSVLYTIGESLDGIPMLVEQDEAEFHVFESILKSTEQKIWKYFYNDSDGLNNHSGIYFSRKDAIKAYNDFARSKGTFTEEQMNAAIDKAFCLGEDSYKASLNLSFAEVKNKILHSLTHPEIKEIVLETEEKVLFPDLPKNDPDNKTWDAIRHYDPVTNQIKCKFIYK